MNEVGISLDTVWMLLAAMLVFWMQPGFALCEAGFTRSKNCANILMKNSAPYSSSSSVSASCLEATFWVASSDCPTGATSLSMRVTCLWKAS